MNKHIHIISFNTPYPPDYGGVIDVYYKLKALKEAGIKISLHSFKYDREEAPGLEKLCERVYYYPRKTGLISQLSLKPYIIFSRRSRELLNNLQKDSDPVFFEGIHSSYYLSHKSLRDRLKILRAHNIEHRYYFKLFKSEKNIRKKFFFLLESAKLYFSERQLKYADYIAAISEKEFRYFRIKFKNVFFLSAFHSNDKVDILPGKGDYLLYHGNLSVPENIKAVNHLIDSVFRKINYPVIIAGKDPHGTLEKKIRQHEHIRIIASPGKQEMKELIRNAQANILFSFQDTGVKLKLLESLFTGRHCIANRLVTGENELKELCETANSPAEIMIKIRKTLDSAFTAKDINIRKQVLSPYENNINAGLLVRILKEPQVKKKEVIPFKDANPPHPQYPSPSTLLQK